jgi:hypothetical protein
MTSNLKTKPNWIYDKVTIITNLEIFKISMELRLHNQKTLGAFANLGGKEPIN